jgi:hypothetical protein
MSFSKDVKRHTDQYRKRLAFVAKTATLNVANDANKVGPSVANPDGGDGGNMPVDTGALRASQVGQPGSMPGDGGETVAAALIRWKPGEDEFYVGWYMEYARAMEAKYGFMRLAAQKWDEIVSKAVAQAKSKNL